jgi:hypothetical protein
MTAHRAVIAACGFVFVAAVALAALSGTMPRFEWSLVAAAGAWLVVGGVLIEKRPGNAVGWLLMAFGVVAGAGMAGRALGHEAGGGFPSDLLHWYGVMAWIPMFCLVVVLLTVFPTGRPFAPWHWLSIWFAAGFAIAATLWNGFTSEIGEEFGGSNPFLIEFVERHKDDVWLAAGGLLIIPAVVIAAVSLVHRYQRAGTVERTQIKWLLAPAVALLPALAFNDASGQAPAAMLSLGVVVFAVPVVIWVAITRHRLYDIDRIVSRTITYVIVLVVLAVVFVGIVGLPVLVLGAGEAPSWLVAISTLVVFSLFSPVRRRVQRVADRRFHRLPYDPDRVTTELEVHLRDAVEPSAIVRAWTDTVDVALQPALSGSWLRSRP